MKIVHIITCLDDGGAEAVLFRLVKELKHDKHLIVSLSGLGKYGALLQSIDVNVIDINMTSLAGKLSAFYRLVRLIKSYSPDVVQTWMYHADFFGGVAARVAGVKNISWGIHNSAVTAKDNPLVRWAMIRITSLLSYIIPNQIVSCSQAALFAHQAIGYDARKFTFIPNGYPVNIFYPDPKAGLRCRAEFGITEGEVLLGMVARFDPQKDHLNLLDALAFVRHSNNFKCLLVGKGVGQNSQLCSEIKKRGLEDYVVLAGQHDDIPKIMNALDICCLSSAFSEAFPNVLCEAMACGTVCVTTDVGDSAFIVGDTGWVVPPRSPEQLAEAITEAIHGLPHVERQIAARRRIVEKFSDEKMVKKYRSVWNNNE
ncbi:MAG: glycosyltransferase [Candidatus Electrothrix sp. AW2]|nr:glycosyltransferase [Candidatus Electrothrix gigas]